MAYLDSVRTAKEVANENDPTNWGGIDVAADARTRAAAGNVSQIAYLNYAAAMANYESRDDVETLAHRRARDIGDQFSDTNFVRAKDYDPFA